MIYDSVIQMPRSKPRADMGQWLTNYGVLELDSAIPIPVVPLASS